MNGIVTQLDAVGVVNVIFAGNKITIATTTNQGAIGTSLGTSGGTMVIKNNQIVNTGTTQSTFQGDASLKGYIELTGNTVNSNGGLQVFNVSGGIIKQNRIYGAGTYALFFNTATAGLDISENDISATTWCIYGAAINFTSSNIHDNKFSNANLFVPAATIKVARNIGYVTENSGTATIASGSTSIVVSHGLATTPTRVFITPTNSMGSAAKFYVDTLTATQFTIHTDVDPGATTAVFNWRAVVGEGN